MIGEKKLMAHGACKEALQWLHSSKLKTLQAAWDVCPRGDWMLWLLQRAPGATQQQLVNIACDCAERVLHHAGDAREVSAAAIAVSRRWAAGEEVTQQELLDAVCAAYAAAYAADSANAARAAADAAAYAAAYAARAAACAAAYAAACAAADDARAAYDAAGASAREEEQRVQADIVRKWVPVAPGL